MGILLDELLEMSRIGRLVNPPEEIAFHQLLQEVLSLMAGPLAEKEVRIERDEQGPKLFGDRPRLLEIWQNLIENAVKYMGDQGTPRIRLGVEETGGEIVFFVRDNGMGIDPRYREKIFGLFEKLDAKSEGSGLGLALVKRIVELYGGRIWVESEGARKGSCFRFTLPGALHRRPLDGLSRDGT
jgi:signal transduction histidine kinase